MFRKNLKIYTLFHQPAIFLVITGLLTACTASTPAPQPSPTIITPSINPSLTYTASPVPDTATPIRLATKTPKYTLALTPTLTRTPKRTLTPTITFTPGPSPTPQLIWDTALESPTIIENYWGSWDPVYSVMIGASLADPTNPLVALTSGPDFQLSPLDLEEQGWVGIEFFWSPAGVNLLANMVHSEEYFDINQEVAELIRLVLQTGQMEFWGEMRWMEVHGWLNEDTVAISEYSGGSHSNLYILNLNKDSASASAQILGQPFKPDQHYLPFVEQYSGPCILSVLTLYAQPEPGATLAEETPNPNVRNFPEKFYPPEGGALFEDWLPASNQMLVWLHKFDYSLHEYQTAELVLWDVDTNDMRRLVPGGLAGRFSPNGGLLAFYTFGPMELGVGDRLLPTRSIDISPDSAPYLYLLDYESREIYLGLPAMIEIDRLTFADETYKPMLAFSPDSRYFAFMTPRPLENRTGGWPEHLLEGGDELPTLNVFDLYDNRHYLEFPAMPGTPIEFAPDSNALVYRDANGNWQLLDLNLYQSYEITSSGGAGAYWNGWSSDSQFFTFRIRNSSGAYDTVVFSRP